MLCKPCENISEDQQFPGYRKQMTTSPQNRNPPLHKLQINSHAKSRWFSSLSSRLDLWMLLANESWCYWHVGSQSLFINTEDFSPHSGEVLVNNFICCTPHKEWRIQDQRLIFLMNEFSLVLNFPLERYQRTENRLVQERPTVTQQCGGFRFIDDESPGPRQDMHFTWSLHMSRWSISIVAYMLVRVA